MELSAVIAKLEDHGRQTRAIKLIALFLQLRKRIKRSQSQRPIEGVHAKSNSSILRSKKNKDKCALCDSLDYSEDSCWKKYPERTLAW